MAYYENQRTKYDIPLSHLDHLYIAKCTNVKELEKILKVLRSGSEGFYPDLEKLTEEQLEKLDQKNKLLRKSVKPLRSNDLNEKEKHELQEYIEGWMEETKVKEKKLSKNIHSGYDDGLPPVRNAVTKILCDNNPEKYSDLKNSTQKRMKPRDYKEWDRYDVDAELNKIDDEKVSESNLSAKAKSRRHDLAESIDSSGFSDELKLMKADYERNKGNEAFKAGDLDEAIIYYGRSISLLPTAAAFNNRALVYLRQKAWSKALDDCNTVLEMEPENLKAILRRASAYQGLTHYHLAKKDLEVVLSEEPCNKNVIANLKEVEIALADQKISGRHLKIEEVEGLDTLTMDSDETHKMKDFISSDISAVDGNEEYISSEETVSEKCTLSSSELLSSSEPKSTGGSDNSKEISKHWVAKGISKGCWGEPDAGKFYAESSIKNMEIEASTSDLSVIPTASNKEVAFSQPPPLLEKHIVALKDEGNELFHRGQYADALQKYNAAINEIHESDRLKHALNLSVLFSNRAACKLKVGNCHGCIEDCDEAVKLFPNSTKPYLRRAIAYEQIEKYRDAYVDYRQAINGGVKNDAALKGSDRCATVLQQLDGPRWREKLPKITSFLPLASLVTPSPDVVIRSSSSSKTVKSNDNDKLFETHKAEGNKLFAKGEYTEAIKCFTKCIELFSDRVVPYTNRALCYLKIVKYDEVLSDCNQALSIEFHNVKALYRRALAYKMQEKYEECLIDLETLLKIDPNNSAAKKELQFVTKCKEEMQEKKAQVACLREQQKLRHRMKIKEVDGTSDNEKRLRQSSLEESSHSQSLPQDASGSFQKHFTETVPSKDIKLEKMTPYAFLQAWKSVKYMEDIQSRVTLLHQVEPEELPLVVSTNLNAGFIIDLLRCISSFVQSGHASKALEYLLYLSRAKRFELEILFLSDTEKDEVREIFDLLEGRLTDEINMDQLNQVRNRYEV